MRPQLRTEMLSILEELSKGKLEGVILNFGGDPLKFEAVYLLLEHGALEETESSSSYRVTISGYDYYQELKSPRVYWIKKNWFPVAVLVVTSMMTVVANVIGALLD